MSIGVILPILWVCKMLAIAVVCCLKSKILSYAKHTKTKAPTQRISAFFVDLTKGSNTLQHQPRYVIYFVFIQ